MALQVQNQTQGSVDLSRQRLSVNLRINDERRTQTDTVQAKASVKRADTPASDNSYYAISESTEAYTLQITRKAFALYQQNPQKLVRAVSSAVADSGAL